MHLFQVTTSRDLMTRYHCLLPSPLLDLPWENSAHLNLTHKLVEEAFSFFVFSFFLFFLINVTDLGSWYKVLSFLLLSMSIVLLSSLQWVVWIYYQCYYICWNIQLKFGGYRFPLQDPLQMPLMVFKRELLVLFGGCQCQRPIGMCTML